MSSRSKVHTRYYNDMMQEVPSVTTILNIIAKPQLIYRAWELGKEGKDYQKEWSIKAGVGDIVHKMILHHLTGKEFQKSNYAPSDIDSAETCFIKYLDWEKENPFSALQVEKEMVSNSYGYGGTPDLVCVKDGRITLIDFKSGVAGKNGSGIYPSMGYQLAAYDHMLVENGTVCTNWMIVRIGRNEKEKIELKSFDSLDDYWDVFHKCLALFYSIEKCEGRN